MTPLLSSNLNRLFVVGFTLLSGCTYLKETIGLGPKRPKVSLENIRFISANPQKIDLKVKLRVDNANGFELKMTGLDYRVWIGELDVAQGDYTEEFTVPAGNFNRVELPLSIDASNAMAIVQRFFMSQNPIKAVLKGEVRFDTPIGEMTIPFHEESAVSRQ